VLATFGPSLTAPHASASLSGSAPIAGTASGEGMTATLVGCTWGITGSDGDNVSTLLSFVGFPALDVEGGIGVDMEGLE